MKKIILLCSNGMSTSMMVAKMKEAAKMMEYEYAAVLRDQIIELRGKS